MLTERNVLDLYIKCATELPSDIEQGIRKAVKKGSGENAIKSIVENIEIAKECKMPMCQDTGTPIFYVERKAGQSETELRRIIENATEEATKSVPLRPNAVDPISGEVHGNKPIIHFIQSEKSRITLLMKGGGSENVSAIYSLPDKKLNAHRDMKGVKKCVMDAVFRAQGKGCPPYTIGVAIGGNIEEVAHNSKKQLIRRIDDSTHDKELAEAEREILENVNKMGIGPSGLGGEPTALSVKIEKLYRHPATFFVGVSFGCWALRRHSYEY